MRNALWLAPLALLAMALPASAAIKTETVAYSTGGGNFKGFLAYDDSAKGPQPGVLVGPEWWGLSDYPRHRAEQLAQLGYVAFVMDPYGDGLVTSDASKANELTTALKRNLKELRLRTTAAYNTLRKNPKVDPSRIAAVGYCFGGMLALELARTGADLKAVVTLHGSLDTENQEADAKNIKARVLVLHGADDPLVPLTEVEQFEKALRAARVDYQVNIYSGAQHAFTNPESDKRGLKGIAYSAEADEHSFEAEKQFLQDSLAKEAKTKK